MNKYIDSFTIIIEAKLKKVALSIEKNYYFLCHQIDAGYDYRYEESIYKGGCARSLFGAGRGLSLPTSMINHPSMVIFINHNGVLIGMN